MTRFFLDTGYALALALPRDQHHAKAILVAQQYDSPEARIVTTDAVLFEITNALAAPPYRSIALGILDGLRRDPRVTILTVDQSLFEEGLALYRARPDKEWTLTDCLSFVVMDRERITEAFAYDHHFQQAGYRPLLREE